MTDPAANALERVQRYLDTWAPFRGGRSLDTHADHHLFLGDLRDVVHMASEGVR